MDQKVTNTGNLVTGVVLLVLGFFLLPLGAGALFSFPGTAFYFGLLLSFSAAVLIYSGIQQIRNAKQQEQKTNQQIVELSRVLASPVERPSTTVIEKQTSIVNPSSVSTAILANWMYTNAEWDNFYKAETKKRFSSTMYEVVALLLVGTLYLMLERNASWQIALLVTAVIGVLWLAGKYLLTLKVMKSKLKKNQIILTTSAVFINGTLHVFQDDSRWIGGVTLLKDQEPVMIEIRYCWNTRKGPTFDELRFPVPDGKLKEAEAVVERLASLAVSSVIP